MNVVNLKHSGVKATRVDTERANVGGESTKTEHSALFILDFGQAATKVAIQRLQNGHKCNYEYLE